MSKSISDESKQFEDELDKILDDCAVEDYENGYEYTDIEKAREAILKAHEEAVRQARIDEVTNLMNSFEWGNGIDPMINRLSQLKESKENK